MPMGEKTKELWKNPEYREHMKLTHLGQVSWNKGKKLPPLSKKHKEKLSEANKGKVSPMKNKKLTEKHKRKIRKTLKSKEHTKEYFKMKSKAGKLAIKTHFKKGHKAWNKNKKCPQLSGKNNPNWLGGKSFEPYGLEFNEDLKEVIRNRDRRKCQLCSKTELENKRKLPVHHIDYDKKNNDPKNLIALCDKCHSKTNANRKYWTNYF